ncbi:MAG: pyridoxal phosphate-dependent aminotransferase [Myxococcales bacterium]|nr:pyridoxal phosphate-dependent aminotransferase [Myxococcales bacterium]
MRFSRRTAFDPTLNPLARARAAREAAGLPLLDLTRSNPTTVDLPSPAAAIMAALADRRALVYEPAPFGLPVARAATAAELGVDADAVVLTASTSEAYGWLFKLLCDPGDEILVPQPSYPLLDHLAQLEAVQLWPYPLAYDGAWHLDRAALSAAVTPRTRAIVVIHPNNPTGNFLSRGDLAHLERLGLPVISDEVFADYAIEPSRVAVPTVRAAQVPVFGLGGLSKRAGLPQMKAGWIVLNQHARPAQAQLELIADTFLSVGAPVQWALPALLLASRETTAAIRARVRQNLDVLSHQLAQKAVTLRRPEGGWTAVLDVPRSRSEEDWVLALLDEHGVLVQPGWFYDFADEAHLVVSLLTPPSEFAEGIARLIHCVERGS